MFECTTCNQNARELPIERGSKTLGLVGYHKVVYLTHIEDSPCSECGNGPGYKVLLHEDTYLRPVEYLFRLFE